jgi:hypothetical protein
MVRLSFLKYLFSTGMRQAVRTALVAGPLPAAGIGLPLFADDSVGDRVVLDLAAAALALFLMILFPAAARRQLKDAFSVCADHTGVHLRPHPDRNCTTIHAPIPGVERAEVLNNLRHHAAGRTEIQS